MPRILIIDDDQASCRTLALHFGQRGFEVDTAENAEAGLDRLRENTIDVVVSDIHMPGRDGISLLTEIGERYEGLPVVMITAFHDLDSTVAAMHAGAVDYVAKPIDIDELETAVDRALTARSDEAGGGDDELVIDGAAAAGSLTGRSRAMQEAYKTIGMVSQSRVTVLIRGESGTGKELVARAIHSASPEAERPFVAVNCGALVETLLESEMFGHEKGAFTGAASARKGKVAMAEDGTLFLDEIGELSPRMQGKLLRLLEAREYSTVGGSKTLTADARFVAATNADLESRVADGSFREDLFYRLNVVNITMPPLRERAQDIPILVEQLLKRINRDIHKSVRRVPADVMEALAAHDWPGNVRELENVLMKGVVMAQGDTLSMAHLPEDIARFAETAGGPTAGEAASDSALSLDELERRHIADVLRQTGWHKGRACEILGVSRPRLERRIKEYGLSQEN